MNLRVNESKKGLIEIEVPFWYVEERDATVEDFLNDLNHPKDVVNEVLISMGYDEQEIEDELYMLRIVLFQDKFVFQVYPPHTLTLFPYIINGVEVHHDAFIHGYLIEHDEHLGGHCECLACSQARTALEETGIAPINSNVEFDNDDVISPVFVYSEDDGWLEVGEYQADTLLQSVGVDFDENGYPIPRVDTEPTLYKPQHGVFIFRELDQLITVARILAEVFDENVSLYYYENRYYLVYDFDYYYGGLTTNERKVHMDDIRAIHTEHGARSSRRTKYFLEEYAKEVFNDTALSGLLHHFG